MLSNRWIELYLNARKSNSGKLQLLHRTVSLYSVDLMKSTAMLKQNYISNSKCLLVIFKAVTNFYTSKLNENDCMIINSSKHLVAYLIPELGFISLIKVLDIHEIHASQLEKIISNVWQNIPSKDASKVQCIHLCPKIVINTVLWQYYNI